MKDEKKEQEKQKPTEHPKPEKPKNPTGSNPHPDTVPAPVGDDGPGNG